MHYNALQVFLRAENSWFVNTSFVAEFNFQPLARNTARKSSWMLLYDLYEFYDCNEQGLISQGVGW